VRLGRPSLCPSAKLAMHQRLLLVEDDDALADALHLEQAD
jgi:hypothetical protein